MDEREKLLRKRAAKSRRNLNYEEVYDTGANAALWGKRSKAVKAMPKVVAKLMGRGVADCGDEKNHRE